MRKKRIPRDERKRMLREGRRSSAGGEDERRREEILRPSPYLGYDHVRLALHLIEREAYEAAEAELRRAIWLNPYDPAFKLHLAFCFYREKKFEEARDTLAAMGDDEKHRAERNELLKLVENKLG